MPISLRSESERSTRSPCVGESVTEALSKPFPARNRVERRLERTVLENRFTIAVVFPLVGVCLLIAGRQGILPAWLALNPALLIAANLVMVSPLIAGLAPLVDRRALGGLALLAVFTWGIEMIGVRTGVPYGTFSYQLDLGPMVFGVPVGLPVFFFPILLNSYLLALLVLGPISLPTRFGLALAFVLAMDLVLDPGAVALGFWAWTDPGAYYGVPAVNYAGWVLSGSVGLCIVSFSFDRRDLWDRLENCPFLLDDLVSFVLFWGLINAYFGNSIPVVLAAAFAGALLWTDRFDFAVLR